MRAASRKYGEKNRLIAPKMWVEFYEKIGRSVAAYERSADVNPFTSKFSTCSGITQLAHTRMSPKSNVAQVVWAVEAWAEAVEWVPWDAPVVARVPIAGQHIAT